MGSLAAIAVPDPNPRVLLPESAFDVRDLIRQKDWDRLETAVQLEPGQLRVPGGEHHRRTPLHFALEHGAPLRAVEALVDGFPQALLEKDRMGRTPLHVAAQFSPVEIVESLGHQCPDALLEKQGAGWTPLHFAARHASVEVVMCLRDMNPQALREKTAHGYTPLHVAAAHATLEVVEALGNTDSEAIQERDTSGWTPLHVASQFASFEIVRYLGNANPQAILVPMDDGRTPLHIAAQHATFETVRYLTHMGSEALSAKDNQGRTPLHVAAQFASFEVVRYLGNENPQALLERDTPGWTPLHIAARFANFEVVRYLGNASPKALSVQDGDGWTPLHLASQRASFQIVQHLVHQCPDALSAETDAGYSPLHIAAFHSRNTEVVAFLARARPEGLRATARDGRLPIDLARRRETDPDKFVECLEAADLPTVAASRTAANLPPSTPGGTSDGVSADPCEGGDRSNCAGDDKLRSELVALLSPISEKLKELHQTANATHMTVTATHEKVEATLPVLSHLDVRLNHPVPRLFLLLPAEIKGGLRQPRLWLRSQVAVTYHLYFCLRRVAPSGSSAPPVQGSQGPGRQGRPAPGRTPVPPPDLDQGGGLYVSLDLGGASALQLSTDAVTEMFDETLGLRKEANRPGLKERLESKKELLDEDVQELNGEAYKFVVEAGVRAAGVAI